MYMAFWSAFEEPAGSDGVASFEQTQTRPREELVARAYNVKPRSRSIAAESEHYRVHRMSQASSVAHLPRPSTSASQTMTATREEKDPIRSRFATIPLAELSGTGTLTKTREESDQRHSIGGLHAIPLCHNSLG